MSSPTTPPPTVSQGMSRGSLPTRSASRMVYDILEIRGRIFRLITRSDLIRCMRVHREGMSLVCNILYREMRYSDARKLLIRPPARRSLYTEAVRNIDARELPWSSGLAAYSSATLREFGVELGAHNWATVQSYHETQYPYHPEILSIIMTGLLSRFPNLRKIVFSIQYDECSVELHDRSSPFQSSSSDVGHIILTKKVFMKLFSHQQSQFLQPLPPPGYTLLNRVHLGLDYRIDGQASHSSDLASQGSHALAEIQAEPWIGDLDRVDLDDLPLSLSQIGKIIEKQAAIGRAEEDRISRISSRNTPPFDLIDFRSFATIAPRSLRDLSLRQRKFREDMCSMSFHDLPAFIAVIRERLPLLSMISLDLAGIEHADRVGRTLLCEDTLKQRGPITYLRLVTKPHVSPLFDVLRALAPLCLLSRGTKVEVGGEDQFYWEDNPSHNEQSNFIRYLQRQPPERRIHLSTLHFPSFGITKLSEVKDLTYRPTGEPQTLAEQKAAGWARDIGAAAHALSLSELVPLLEVGLQRGLSLSSQFQAMASTATNEEALEEAEKLLSAMKEIRRLADRIAQAAPASTLKDVADVVAELKRRIAAKGMDGV